MYNMKRANYEEQSPPLSPSFKQNEGSFFQKQKAQSNKLALTPTKQRLIRASSITSMFDLNQLKDPTVFSTNTSLTPPKFDSQCDNEYECKQIAWNKKGEPFDVYL